MRRLFALAGAASVVALTSLAIASPLAVIDVYLGPFFIEEGDEYLLVRQLGSTIYMSGGEVVSLDTLDDSFFSMTGGTLQSATILDSSTCLFEGGAVQTLQMLADAEAIIDGADVTNGSIQLDNSSITLTNGSFSGVAVAHADSTIDISGREFSFDDDLDPLTPNIPIGFGKNEIRVLSPGDDLFHTIVDPDLYPAASEIRLLSQLRFVSANGSEGVVDVIGRSDNDDPQRSPWTGSLTLRLLQPTDLTGDSVVNNSDLALLFAAWGDCDTSSCTADINNDGVVDSADLAVMLAAWG